MSTTPSERGAHQRRRSSGFVIASKTVLGCARKTRRKTSSRSEARSTWVPDFTVPSLLVPALIGLVLLCFELHQELVQCFETRVPQLAIPLQPAVELPEGLGAQRVDPLLGAGLHVDQARFPEDAQVLGDLWLVELQALPDVTDAA